MKNVPTKLSNLKSKVDKLDVNKLVSIPVNLNKLSDVVKNDVVEKDLYNAKIKNIEDKIPDIIKLATITTLKVKVNEIKGEMSNFTNLASLNAKINNVKGETPSVTNLVTATTALTAVENEIPSVSNLIKKTDFNTKISEIENKIATDHDHYKYITTQEFNKLTSENFTASLKQANLASKNDTVNFVKKKDFDNKIKDVTSSKNDLNKQSQNVKAISTKGLTKHLITEFSILNGAKYFYSETFQNYLAFLLAKKCIKYFSGTTWIQSWKSNGMSEENIENITKSDSNFAPTFVDHHLLPDINFNEHCLTLIWVGFLGVPFEVWGWGGGIKLPLPTSPV